MCFGGYICERWSMKSLDSVTKLQGIHVLINVVDGGGVVCVPAQGPNQERPGPQP